MNEISNENVSNNGVNEAGVYNEVLAPDRCSAVRTCFKKLLSKKGGRYKIMFV